MGKLNLTLFGQRKKIKSLFNIKDNVKHLSCVIYQRICSCGNNYVGETMGNATTRINEYEQSNGKSEPSKHLKSNPGHKIQLDDITESTLISL